MKMHKEHKAHKAHKAAGGKMEKKPQETPETGYKEWEQDENDRPERRNNAPEIEDAAEERKHGGKAKHKKKNRGGPAKKNVGYVAGGAPKESAARMPRKSGGRAGCEGNPFSSARSGTAPKGHKDEVDID